MMFAVQALAQIGLCYSNAVMTADNPIEGAIPAATLVLMRPGAKDAELLLVKRAATMAFAAGAVVFPGGRIDPDDYVVASMHGKPDSVEAAARVAALRETLEETGLAVGWPSLAVDAIPMVRAALLAEHPLSALLADHGARLELDALVPFARWCPNFKESRTFDTWFFAAEAPDHGHELTVSEAEHSHIFWDSAADALTAADRGEISVIFPTRRNLERLAGHRQFHSFAAHASAYPVERITPWVEERDGIAMLCIPENLGYPVTCEAWQSVRRG
jgi:8-oxo-dGTP pyrophosphatase MutT (NUDIX family)